MPDELNLVKNPRFAEGKRAPLAWTWVAQDGECVWERLPGPAGDGLCRMEVRLGAPAERREHVRATWSQRVRCDGGEYYRVEALVCVDPSEPGVGDADSGVVLRVQPFQRDEPAGLVVETPPFRSADGTIRTLYKAPAGATALEVCVGLRGNCGRAVIREVLVLPVLEPDAISHPVAIPPPPYAQASPRRVRTVAVVGDFDESRPLVRALRVRFGDDAVRVIAPASLRPRPDGSMPRVEADAIVMPDPELPPGWRSLAPLASLGERHVVVVSMHAFASLSRGAVEVRTIRQKDDPIWAEVYESNFITRGFALRDCFPFARRGAAQGDPRVFIQPQFRQTQAFKAFCAKHEFVTMLRSQAGTDATSQRPISLFKPAAGGGILVLDTAPIEADATSMNEPGIALLLLLNALGVEQSSLGQYTVPAESRRAFCDEMAEFERCFPPHVVRGVAPPYRADVRPIVRLGRDPEMFGLPAAPRPMILIRTGLSGDDLDGLYGTMYWLKNLVRPVPCLCPYAEALTSRFQIAWAPLHADWPAAMGWRSSNDPAPAAGPEADLRGAAAVIDVTNGVTNDLRVLMSSGAKVRPRIEESLPGLWDACFSGRYVYEAPEDGGPLADRGRYAWRVDRQRPRVVTDDRVLDSELHRSAAAGGADLIRIETPSSPADFSCSSIWRTDRVATLLELIVGLRYGLIVMNRRGTELRVPLPPGAAGARDSIRILKATSTPGEVAASPTPAEPVDFVCLSSGEAVCWMA